MDQSTKKETTESFHFLFHRISALQKSDSYTWKWCSQWKTLMLMCSLMICPFVVSQFESDELLPVNPGLLTTADTTAKIKPESSLNVIFNDHRSMYHSGPLIMIPFQRQARCDNYYHVLQSLGEGIAHFTNVTSDLSTAQRWTNIRVVWLNNDYSNTRLPRKDLCVKAFDFFDGRVLPNGEFRMNDDHNKPVIRQNNKSNVDKPKEMSTWLWNTGFKQESLPWIQTLAESKFGIRTLKYEQRDWSIESRQEYCESAFQLDKVSVLLVNRMKGSRTMDLSGLAQGLQESGMLGKVTYIKDVTGLTVAEQASLFATHMVSITPHGASEANLIFANGPAQREGPPHIAIEMGVPYGDCAQCNSQTMVISFRFYMPWMLVYSVGLRTENLTCDQFCKSLPKGRKRPGNIRDRFRNYTSIPVLINSTHLTHLISQKIQDRVIPHCKGVNIESPTYESDPLVIAESTMDSQSEIYHRFQSNYQPVLEAAK